MSGIELGPGIYDRYDCRGFEIGQSEVMRG